MNSRFTEIGRIGKARGLDGVTRFLPETNFTDDLLSPGSIVYIKNERSDLVPMRIESVYQEEKKNQVTFFVKFDLIANRSDADAAMDKAVYTDREVEPIEAESSDEPDMTGYDVIYNDTIFGSVLDLMSNPAHSILEVKTESGSLLIPFVDEFVDDTDHQKKVVYCINLDQLTDS